MNSRASSSMRLLVIGSVLALVSYGGAASMEWPVLGFTQAVATAFSQPTSITHAGDASQRVFVTEQVGRVQIIHSGNVLPQPFLDITNRVLTTGAEQGLLGLAFPPGYSTNGHFYVDYTRVPDGAVVISRFQVSTNGNIADTNSEQIIIVIAKSFNNHNGGQLAFGPDGYLYIGVGDGGSEGDPQLNGQKTSTLLGKLLRIDVESGVSPYAFPTNNPFLENTNYLAEIWALGLRNPWRFSFDRLTGDLYIGDVGQGRYEEIDFHPFNLAGGQNYGWRIMEGATNYQAPPGFTNFSSLTLPIHWYERRSIPTDLSASVTGGYVYRGPAEPRMDGMYFYGDFMAGWIWGLKRVGTNWQNFPLLSPPAPPHFSISTFGENEQGQLYMADYYKGKIYQMVDTHQSWTPVFAPTNGIINSNMVAIYCASPNAEIHYTTNNLDPTISDPFISSGELIRVNAGSTNKARAFRPDLMPSSVASSVFTFKVGTPIFTPPASSVTNDTSVSISTVTPNAMIHYTTNGTNPTTNSPIYLGSLIVRGNTTFRALGAAVGYSNSTVATAAYSIIPAATPSFSPVDVLLTNTTAISISCATPGAIVRYTVDGTNPTTNSATYISPIEIDIPTTLKAAAYRDDLAPSAVRTSFYGFLYYENTVVTTYAGSPTAGFSNAVGGLAQFSTPQAICRDDSGNLLVGDRGNHMIRMIRPSGEVQTFAGSGIAGYEDGPAADAQFEDAAGVCRGRSGNVFVSEGGCGAWRVRKIDTNLMVSTVGTLLIACSSIGQIEADPADNLYAGYANSINKITPTGQLTILGNYGGFFTYLGVGMDASTNIYPVESGQVWRVAIDGTQTLVAGTPTKTGFSDGPQLLALFGGLLDAVVDYAGNVFVSEPTRVRKISPGGMVTTIAGTGIAGYANGRGSMAQFSGASGVCLDTNGNLYVTDSGNNCVRKISPDTVGIGIADDWQVAHFGHVGIEPNSDPDHDGMSNFAEFWAGTDPLDYNSALVIGQTSLVSNGHIQIVWKTVVGKTYTVQYSTDLTTWNHLGDVQGNGSTASVTDPTPMSQAAQLFYRVIVSAF